MDVVVYTAVCPIQYLALFLVIIVIIIKSGILFIRSAYSLDVLKFTSARKKKKKKEKNQIMQKLIITMNNPLEL